MSILLFLLAIFFLWPVLPILAALIAIPFAAIYVGALLAGMKIVEALAFIDNKTPKALLNIAVVFYVCF